MLHTNQIKEQVECITIHMHHNAHSHETQLRPVNYAIFKYIRRNIINSNILLNRF